MRLHLAVALLTGVLARPASAQATAHPSAVGTWRGTSLCLVRPSSCNDETVVYRIMPLKSADSVTIDALKIVRGEEQDMGALSCRFVAANGQLTCAMPNGVWHFRVTGDSLTGELRLPDNTKFRDVRTKRAP